MVEPVPVTYPGRKLKHEYHKFQFGRNEFEVGTRYVNLKPIGKGAYGLVCSAEDKVTGRKVAIKRVGKVFQDLIDAKRILREIKLLRHLGAHDNIMEIVDLQTGPPETQHFKHLYIITQLYECDLDRIISSSQRLTDSHAQYFLYQILRGLKYMHSASVLHRDLKPPNLLVNSNCDLAICDFGLSRGISSETEGKLTEYVVTRWYRAPELLCECATYGPPVDVWSAGCIFAEILSRRPLFQGASSPAQLDLIIRLLGTPSDDDLEGMSKFAKTTIKGMPKHSKKSLSTVFPGVNPLALDLLGKMLVFNPDKRITVVEALGHEYLTELHSKAAEPECHAVFNFDYERDYPDEMPQELLQKHMFEESLDLETANEAKAAAAGGAGAKGESEGKSSSK